MINLTTIFHSINISFQTFNFFNFCKPNLGPVPMGQADSPCHVTTLNNLIITNHLCIAKPGNIWWGGDKVV